MGTLGRTNVFVIEPMEIITQQGTTKAKAGTMRRCAWVIVVQVMGYLVNLGFLQDSGIPVGEGGEWLDLVVVEGGDVIPRAILLVPDY
jgi:hypothetical protein